MTVGGMLAAARQQAGLSVADVAQTTRVRGGLIQAIEADDFGGCGGAVYARGHVRNISAAVGADTDEVMAEFDASHGGRPPEAVVVTDDPGPTFRPDLAPSGRKGPNLLAAAVVAVIAVGAIAGVSLLGQNSAQTTASDLPSASPSASAPAAAPSSQAPAPQSTAPSPPANALAEAVPGQVTLGLTITGARSWVRVSSASGATLFQGLLEQGATKSFTDPTKLNLLLGDSGAVGLVVNGQDVGIAGGSGQVTRASFTPADPAGQG